jgi:hypothetical protein
MSSATLEAEAKAHGDLFGLAAEFDDVEHILEAATAARDAGYVQMDAYTPFAVEGLDDALGMRPTRLGWVVLGAGLTGLLGGFFLQWYANTSYYPLVIGGKPFNSWPNWIVIMYECTILFSAFTAGLVMILRNGLPRPYHSIFNTPGFENASRDRFFLCIEARDPSFDLDRTRALLESLGPNRVSEVER